ncbi:thioredoxin-like fold domain-containing protein MRL7L, chloroplastic isoform X1 [Salvia splendens]|uniref:thioredoxin-like fold domain-containing protein MRL7L, chloroplastic isoform X1 n=1 Tax=Salvia splendens TaxID=180675 RepID=UPI001C25C412|nr:thioredoxin-like fold domain-containing protein MRL7L, chloroplastic isoform X1 [Salvia splendens]XP_041991573.1 thioredoxin-like fold domain-containing protein MRL7L, chloroplastic isoform X1 [Salvia splendens]XP_041991575.1 thioredoxin-like fold domain-containing protein MRL7L, chloroplastic isoform X1 [Salvia splendens]XP_041991576.1 thioredoxin-like fold domain-containing protein MRL7L, chloroplastic isoform X1 [Salvia splendens]XP_041991577.1 thioredoxin-like fold domain-containing prot
MALHAMGPIHHRIWRLQVPCLPAHERCLIRFPSYSGTSLTRQSSRCCIMGSSNTRHVKKFTRPLPMQDISNRGSRVNVSKVEELLRMGEGDGDDDEEESGGNGEDKDSFVMDENERKEWRQKIREVMSRIPDDADEETDMLEKRKRMQKLLAEYPLVVEEEDPDWPEDADGWGFSLGQFFNKISIKNVKKEDDENYESENEIVWKDDDYIRPIKDITTAEWEEAIYKDISPLVVLVHNRYKRPKENEKIREEIDKAVQIIWNCRLPSPRCVAIDANTEFDLVSALKVSVFPEIIFTKAGKILYREKAIRTADELSKIMAFFYFGAAKPPCLSEIKSTEETIPTVEIRSQHL